MPISPHTKCYKFKWWGLSIYPNTPNPNTNPNPNTKSGFKFKWWGLSILNEDEHHIKPDNGEVGMEVGGK